MFSGDAVLANHRVNRRVVLLQYTTVLLVLNGIVFLFLLIPFLPGSGLSDDIVTWHSSHLVKALVFIAAPASLLLELLAVITSFRCAWAESRSKTECIPLFVILLLGLGSIVSVAMLINIYPWSATPKKSYGMFLLLRSVNLGNGVSPLMPILLVGGAGLLMVVSSLRRINLLEECAIPLPFLNFRSESFEGVSQSENRIEELLECRPSKLPGTWLIIPMWLILLIVALRGRPSYPVDGRLFDWALRFSAFLVYAAFTLVFLRFVSVWMALRRLLHRLYWHPTRSAYESLRESLPGDVSDKKRIYLMEPRPSYTATEASLNCARGIVGSTNFPYLRTAVACAERCLRHAYQTQERSGSSTEVIESRVQTERAMSLVSGAITSIFDAQWRTQRAQSQLSKVDRRIVGRLADQANLFIASRVVDLLRQVVPQLQNFASFGTASMLLMLFAMSSYPFPQRDTFLWLSWSTLLGALLVLLVVFVQMSRDRIMSLLSGTVPGKLSWDASLVNQIVLFGVVPVLGLLGAQFPDVFRQFFSWASKIGGTR
jgi:hypothetical protein